MCVRVCVSSSVWRGEGESIIDVILCPGKVGVMKMSYSARIDDCMRP